MMRKLLMSLMTILTLQAYGQDKYNYVHFNKLTEVIGTDYVIASIENWGKMLETKSMYLLFINTRNGETKQIELPNDARIEKMEQIKIDSLGINLFILSARTVDLDNKNGIDWKDPTQILILSIDGSEKTQLTESSFFVRTWTINKITGNVVITGHFDTNNNSKYDKTDKNEIHIYDLKRLKLLFKI